MPARPAALCDLAALVEALAATSSRLKKVALLAAYLAPLSDDDLARAVHLLAARPFGEADRRRLQMGGAGILAAMAPCADQDVAALRAELTRQGDFAALAAAVLPKRKPNLTLAQLTQAFVEIAATSKPKARQEALALLLQKADAAEGRVIAGVVSGELRIGLKHSALEAAIAQILELEVEKIQHAHMLRGDLGEVAALGRHDKLHDLQMRLFAPLQFMLATPIEIAAPSVAQLPKPFIAEDKFDGIRVQVHVGPEPHDKTAGKVGAKKPKKDAAADEEHRLELRGECIDIGEQRMRVALFSRTHDDITAAFAELIEPIAKLALATRGADSLILDGELLAMRDGRALPFITLQRRLGRKTITQALRDEVPVTLVAFDVLYADTLLLEEPWHARNRRLHQLPFPKAAPQALMLAASPQLMSPEELDDAFAAARERGHEGLVIKHPEATYKPGRRGRDWLKMKLPQATFDVVVTAAEVGFGRRHKWLSDYTFAVRTSETDDTLLNVGKAYSGLTDQEIAELTTWFKEHTKQTFAHGRVRVVEPQIVIEVACDRVQPSPRHKAGYALRFARIVRLRPDKSVADIDTLETVAAIAKAQEGPAAAPQVQPNNKPPKAGKAAKRARATDTD